MSFQIPPGREYQIKAAFLFNFTQFVEWPPSTFPEPKAPLIIGILGEDNFGSYLDEMVSGEIVNGHSIVVQRYHYLEDIKACHILFISGEQVKKLEKTIVNLKGRNILTVSDVPDFIQKGGMIRFFTFDNKIRFQINPEATKIENITVSSKLLRLAEIVVPNKN